MIIDCDSCAVRDIECADCVVSVLLGGPHARDAEGHRTDLYEFDGREQAALAVLADSGMVPPLRLVPGVAPPDGEDPGGAADRQRAAG